MMCLPCCGLKRTRRLRLTNMAQRIWEFLSFRVKYQCPEAGVARFEISPSTSTEGKLVSSRERARRLRLVTLRTSSPACPPASAGLRSNRFTASYYPSAAPNCMGIGPRRKGVYHINAVEAVTRIATSVITAVKSLH